MSDSLSPSNRNPLPENATEPRDTPEEMGAMRHQNLGNPEAGVAPPDASRGRDSGPLTPERVHEVHLRTEGALDDRNAGNVQPELSDDDLSRLSLLASGTLLREGEVYLDLDDLERGPYEATGAERVGVGDRIVSRADVDAETWERLTDRAPGLKRMGESPTEST